MKSDALSMLSIYGVLLIFAGGIHLLPLPALIFYPDEFNDGLYIAVPAVFAMTVGFALRVMCRKKESRISASHGAVLVCILWISSVLVTAAPYVISGRLNFTQAFFEGMNCWTTTSMSFLEPDLLPHVLLLCRSVTCFFGGVGLICVVLATVSEAYGMRLYNAEGHLDRILPNLVKSVRMIMSLFAIYFAAGTVAYIIAGMPVFDAINHGMTALATGGMSVKSESIISYGSLPIEIITMILMILGSTNFMVHMLIIKRKFRQLISIAEIRCFIFLIIAGTILMSFALTRTVYGSAGMSFRMSLFNTISVITTTGFATLPYAALPQFAVALIIFFMFVGGCAGSTAGGIKIGRLYLLYKYFVWNIKNRFTSERKINELSVYYPQGKVYIKEEHYFEAANYVFLHMTVLFFGVLVLTAHGYSLRDSLYEFTAVMGTTGLSSGIISLETPKAVLWTMSIGMFLGRLEIIVIFLAVAQMFKDAGRLLVKRKKKMERNR